MRIPAKNGKFGTFTTNCPGAVPAGFFPPRCFARGLFSVPIGKAPRVLCAGLCTMPPAFYSSSNMPV